MSEQNRAWGSGMDETDEKLIRLTQDGIEFTHAPFEKAAAELGISEEEIVRRLKRLTEERKIRRFGASIGHIALGFTANGMGVWDVPEDKIEEIGQKMASFHEVSHCYRRPRSDEWPYNMYTMIHGRTTEECLAVAENISTAVGISEYKLVFSERELKKKGVRI
ncbi:MAG: AsnC family transcriptional regulator [Methanosarcinales archaeon]|jgi:DNA-binding Lrp family transcriptional regulator|nr:AsnC family transcriptional regulator [Methanosarcinales archaeon]